MPEEAGGGASIELTPEQVASAGLDGLQPGDSFTVTISGTVTDTDNGLEGKIESASSAQDTEPDMAGEMSPMSHSERFPSARAAGFDFGK